MEDTVKFGNKSYTKAELAEKIAAFEKDVTRLSNVLIDAVSDEDSAIHDGRAFVVAAMRVAAASAAEVGIEPLRLVALFAEETGKTYARATEQMLHEALSQIALASIPSDQIPNV